MKSRMVFAGVALLVSFFFLITMAGPALALERVVELKIPGCRA